MEPKQRKPRRADYGAGQITFRISPEIKSQLQGLASRLRVTPSELARVVLISQMTVMNEAGLEIGDARPSTRREAEALLGRLVMLLGQRFQELFDVMYDEYGNLKPPPK